jgi:PAS domain-containing protein
MATRIVEPSIPPRSSVSNGDGERPRADSGEDAGEPFAEAGGKDEGAHQLPADVGLFRQLADSLSLPMCIVDARGEMVHYNRSAELVLGQPYTRALTQEEWAELWSPTNLEGAPIPAEQLPLTVALRDRRPAHGWLSIASLDGVSRRLEVTAFPVESGGAVALFWQVEPR